MRHALLRLVLVVLVPLLVVEAGILAAWDYTRWTGQEVDVYAGLWIAGGLNLLVAVGSGLLAMKTSGGLIRQLRRLQTHAETIGRGEPGHYTESASVRELAELATAFNRMGAAVHDAQQKLEAANAALDQRVRERTAQLATTIRRLESEVSQRLRTEKELQQYQAHLEELVQQRTGELGTANEQLQKEIAGHERTEASLKRTAEQLARSNEELEQFAYVASHDLQEPLRVISGYVQLIEHKYKGQLDADADQFLNYIVDGATRMRQLITDLLDYSRLATRGKPLRPTNLQEVLDHVRADLKGVIEESGAVLTCGPLPTVRGDEIQLTRLFQNLVGNALKFRSDHPPKIDVSASRDGDRWTLAVRDNGIGIERQYWERIFVIFQRLHTRHKYPGTGIGLAICKRIVERHGGTIWLDSRPGEGTTFYFTLTS
jgi:signal transduction histidine kinase